MPHLAIVPSILHYTEPGDIVLDGFAGSGMTGVAAQWVVGQHRRSTAMVWSWSGKRRASRRREWGARGGSSSTTCRPAATFIAANYNLPFDVDAFAEAGKTLLKEVDEEVGWMYETLHTDGKTKGRIEYTVWSEVCIPAPSVRGEINFTSTRRWTPQTKRVREHLPLPPLRGAQMNEAAAWSELTSRNSHGPR